METLTVYRNVLLSEGFTIIDNVYSNDEVDQILSVVESADSTRQTFRKSNDLFAIRQFLNEVPASKSHIFTDTLKSIINEILGVDYFVVKSIYFDKPQASNWYVSYHQDLTIAVDKKTQGQGFQSWTTKHNQFAVQPPKEILENLFTIRIHLDDTNENNGALKVIPKSH